MKNLPNSNVSKVVGEPDTLPFKLQVSFHQKSLFFSVRKIREISIVIQAATDRVLRSQNNVPMACFCQPVFSGNSVECQHRFKDISGKQIHSANW